MYDVNQLPLSTLKSLEGEPAPYFIRDGMLFLSCETDVFVADYYSEFGIEKADSIEQWAKENGGYWEWVNPGCLQFCLD